MDRLKVLHTGDIHLGAKFTGLGVRGREQRRKLAETFGKIIDLAINAGVHLVLVAGDLFDSSRPASDAVDAVVRGLARLERHGIEVCLSPGTHDRYSEACVYRRPEFTERPNLHVFTGADLTPREFPLLSATVWGRALVEAQPGDILAGLHRDTPSVWQLALVHGSVRVPGLVESDEAMIDTASLGACRMDYVALGHWHSLADHSRWGTPAFYCGAPEPISVRDREAGYVILAEFAAGAPPEIKPVRVSRRRADVLHVNMDEIADAGELRSRIQALADEDLMLDVVLRGLTRYDLLVEPWELTEELSPLFFHLRIRDESSLSIADLARLRLPENTLGGRLLRIAQERMAGSGPEERRLLEEAVKVGLAYLARGDAG